MVRWAREAIFRACNEAMLQAAFSTDELSIADRLQQLQAAESRTRTMVERELATDPHVKGPAILGFTALSCLPSLEAIIQKQPHTPDIAQRVTHNLQQLARAIVGGDTLEKLDATTSGYISETAVLSILWWGIAHDKTPPPSHAVLATNQQNHSMYIDGKRTGIDIIMQTGDGESHAIQVKSSRKNMRSPGYILGITIITPRNLADPSQGDRAINQLMGSLAVNDRDRLSRGFDRAQTRMAQTKKREKQAKVGVD